MNADGTDLTRLTYTPENEGLPVWSPEDKHIAFVSDDAIKVMNHDGSNPTPVFAAEGVRVGQLDWWQPLPYSELQCRLPLLQLWC